MMNLDSSLKMTKIKMMALISITFFVQQSLAAKESSIVGVHVHSNGTLKGFETVEEAKKTCDMMHEQSRIMVKMGLSPHKLAVPWKLTGSAADLDRFTQDEYFSSDGAYIAIYKKGHNIKSYTDSSPNNGSPCVVEIVPYEETLLYDLRARALYHFDPSNPNTPDWYKTKILSVPSGVSVLNVLGQQNVTSKVKNLGKNLIANLPCDRSSSGALSRCTWHPSHNEVQFPKSLELMSELKDEKTTTRIIAESVNLHEKLDASIFHPPSNLTVHDVAAEILNDPNNATDKWCAAEKKKTGVDPCVNDDN
jgi:hypothetical protein